MSIARWSFITPLSHTHTQSTHPCLLSLSLSHYALWVLLQECALAVKEISVMDKSSGQSNWIGYQEKEPKMSRARRVKECQKQALTCLFPLPYPKPWEMSELEAFLFMKKVGFPE